MSSLPSPPAEEAGGSDAGMEGRGGGSQRRRVVAGDSEGHPVGVPPGPGSHEAEDADAVFGGGGVFMYDGDAGEEASEPGSRAPGARPSTSTADGSLRPNTCSICWEPWASYGAHRIS
jgi:hypothetical protein